MPYEIHIYLGSACITPKSNYDYPDGEKHAFLLYLRAERSSQLNHKTAEDVIINEGLSDIEFSKAGKLDENKINNQEKLGYYENAIKTGSTLILYSEPMDEK